MANTLFWSAYADADCTTFNVYRALTGIAVNFPNSLAIGDVFSFSAISSDIQNITLTATDISSVAATLTAKGRGIRVAISSSGSTLFIRCTGSIRPVFRLYPCTFLTHIGQSPRFIGPAMEFTLLTSIARVQGNYDYSALDLDGDPSDWYRLTTARTGNESVPSLPMQAMITPEPFCVIEGRVVDLQNNPISGAEVIAAVQPQVGESSNSGIVLSKHTVMTDMLGRWSVSLLQGQSVMFRIPSIGYNQGFTVPQLDYILFDNLNGNLDYYFSPNGEPQGGIDFNFDDVGGN